MKKLKLELASNPAVKKISLPLPKEWYTEGEASTCTAYSPVPVHGNIDGVDMKFDASVVVDVFPQGVCLGPHELRCYSISKQEPTGEARIDERASLVVSFAVPDANPIPLRGMVDTGSGVSIMSFSAFNRVALRTGVALQPYRIDSYAANGKTMKTFGIAERVRFQHGGYELETNFVVVDDAHGLEDFLLGRNFLRAYNVLVDLTAMKIVVRAPAKPVWHHAHAQTSDETLSSTLVLDQDVVLQPFERAVLRAKLVTSNLEAFAFSNVVINFATSNRLLKNTIFVEDTLATVGETGSFYLSVGNLTSNAQKVKCGTMLGTAAPVRLVYHAVPQCALAHKGKSDEKSDSPNEFVNRVYSEMDLNSHSKCSSSSEFEFLSSTDPSEEGLSEREIRKRTDPDLLAPIPGPEFQLEEVQKLWGQTARDSLNNILTEFDDLFMKHKADIGRCTIPKHPVELEPGAVPHREGARRMSPEKAERANKEVRNLLALGMIQPSLSPWASGIVMVKKKNGELRFCCDFRPLNAVTIKDAYPLPRIDESLSRLGKAKIYTSIDLAWAFWQIPVRKADRQKTAFACELGLFEWRRMPFGMCNASVTFQRAVARALRKIVNREGSMVMAYIDDIVIATETVEDHMVRLREVFECLQWQWQNHAIRKYRGTKQRCKAFWASPTIIESSFLGMPSLWPPCMLLPAWAQLSPGGMSSNRLSTPSKLEKLPAVTDKWNFLSQEEFDQLPVAPWFDLHGQVIPNHPQLPAHLRNTKPYPTNAVCRVARRRRRRQAAEKRERALRAPLPEALVPTLQTHEDVYPDCPEDWIDVTEEARQITCCLHMWQISLYA